MSMKNIRDSHVQQNKLSQEAIEARRAYQRAWRKKNPHKQAEYSMRFWTKKAKESEVSND